MRTLTGPGCLKLSVTMKFRYFSEDFSFQKSEGSRSVGGGVGGGRGLQETDP